MENKSSRRSFLAAAGLALPTAALASIGKGQQAAKLPPPAAGGFSYRVLGKTGLKVTSVGFGCMITSDPSVIERAADIGITYFDSARSYQNGNNERMVGAALKAKRNSITLSTKTGARTKEEALKHIDTSLTELGTDHVDIWYLHGKSRPEELTDELLEAQQIAKKAGKTRFVGVSTHSGQPELFPAVIQKMPHFDVILTSYNFTMDPKMDEVIASAVKQGIGIVAMKVMAGGFRRAKPGDRTAEILKREGAMLAALKWVLRNKNVGTTVPSMTDNEQLDENLKAMSVAFSDADQKILAAQLDHISALYCRMCGQCSGLCPKGVPVSDVLRYLSYAEGYGQFQLARESFLSLPREIRDVRCKDCVTCSIRCPNGVRVTERLQTAQELLA
jgi:predicted aldo/keto reductase-like oxidoreductase